ncbi:hypothetical protein V8C34DRAFT_299025 [Trichoderma compactum]
MDRFLQRNDDESGENYRRRSPGLGEPQSEIEAEERMRRLLDSFNERFGPRRSPSGS